MEELNTSPYVLIDKIIEKLKNETNREKTCL